QLRARLDRRTADDQRPRRAGRDRARRRVSLGRAGRDERRAPRRRAALSRRDRSGVPARTDGAPPIGPAGAAHPVHADRDDDARPARPRRRRVTTRDEDALERLLDRIEELDQQGDVTQVRREVTRGRNRFPESIDLMEWEAMLAAEEEDPEHALGLLDAILARAPRRFWPRRERAAALLDLGRFGDALVAIDDALSAARLRDADERPSPH